MDRVFDSDQNQSPALRPLILAVEDNLDNLWLLEAILEAYTCELIRASDGQSALSLAQRYQPGLILLDIVLPGMSGLEVLRQLKQNPLTQPIPVIAVTGLAKLEDRQALLEAGCEQHVSKPYMLDELEAILSRYLNRVATALHSEV